MRSLLLLFPIIGAAILSVGSVVVSPDSKPGYCNGATYESLIPALAGLYEERRVDYAFASDPNFVERHARGDQEHFVALVQDFDAAIGFIGDRLRACAE